MKQKPNKKDKHAILQIPEGTDFDDAEQVEALASALVKELEKQGVKFSEE